MQVTFDETTLDSCKSAIVYDVTKRLSTPGSAVGPKRQSIDCIIDKIFQALSSLNNQVLRGVPQNHTSDLLKKYQAVTIQDVTRVIRLYFLPLFDPERSVATVVTGPSKANEIAAGLEDVGFEVERREISGDMSLDDSESSESEES